MGLRRWLGLKKPRAKTCHVPLPPPHHACRTIKSWPAHVAELEGGSVVTFGIALRSARTSPDWRLTEGLLAATLRSVLRQSDARFRILICGHEIPDIPEIADERVEFIGAEWQPPGPEEATSRFRVDYNRKRFVIGQRMRSLGGGFLMKLDSDDLLHRDLTGFILSTPNGAILDKGFMLDHGNRRIAAVPGAFDVDIDRFCGSTAAIRYRTEDFPESWESKGGRGTTLFNHTAAHGYVRGTMEEFRRPLAPVPFPAVIYRVNTSDNVSFTDQRQDERREKMLAAIGENAITDAEQLRQIGAAFGTAIVERLSEAHDPAAPVFDEIPCS